MDPMTIGLMAGAGLLKSELVDRPREEEQRRQAAITARWSPWTGMTPNAIQTADPIGSAMQAGLTGAMLSQGQQRLDADIASQKAKDTAELSLAGGAAQPQMNPQQFLYQQQLQNQSYMNPQQNPYMYMNR
jgi:hypothetical protein